MKLHCCLQRFMTDSKKVAKVKVRKRAQWLHASFNTCSMRQIPLHNCMPTNNFLYMIVVIFFPLFNVKMDFGLDSFFSVAQTVSEPSSPAKQWKILINAAEVVKKSIIKL